MAKNKFKATPEDLRERILAAIAATQESVGRTQAVIQQSRAAIERADRLRQFAKRKQHLLP
jgi:ElaB/YqjD/DUF883 family membrane-anchored ribosome-binding protein